MRRIVHWLVVTSSIILFCGGGMRVEAQTPEPAFAAGSRGFIVHRLQAALGIKADGFFGAVQTAAAVRALQTAKGFVPSGRAGAREFAALGLAWPTDFELALQATVAEEHPRDPFQRAVGQCNTISDDGVTFGIIGFQAKSGSLKRLLIDIRRNDPAVFQTAAQRLTPKQRDTLSAALDAEGQASLHPWGVHLVATPDVRNFGSPPVGGRCKQIDPEVAAFFWELGGVKSVQAAQIDQAWRSYGQPATVNARLLFQRSDQSPPSALSLALLYDIHVFHGGLKASTLDTLRSKTWSTATDRRQQIADAALAEIGDTHPHKPGARRRWFNRVTGTAPDGFSLTLFGLLVD